MEAVGRPEPHRALPVAVGSVAPGEDHFPSAANSPSCSRSSGP